MLVNNPDSSTGIGILLPLSFFLRNWELLSMANIMALLLYLLTGEVIRQTQTVLMLIVCLYR